MVATNFPAALTFVWRAGFDCPSDGCHTSPHDPGGATKGGVTQAVWDAAVRVGLTKGSLAAATDVQLGDVLKATCWSPVCEHLPGGLDLLLFNGKMMSGGFYHLTQQCLGLMAGDVDGWLGPQSLGRMQLADAPTLIDAISGCHYGYLSRLPTWARFGHGWTTRLEAAQAEAHAMAIGR